MNILSIALMAIIGAIIYRLRGWGPKPPATAPWWKTRPLLQACFAIPFAAVALSMDITAAIIVLVLTTGAILTGHASYIDLGSIEPGSAYSPSDGNTEEWYGAFLPGAGYWHDFAGLMISGMLISAPCGLAILFTGNLGHGLAIIALGTLKAPAYAIGWVAYERTAISAILIGELATGALLWGTLAAITI